MNPPEEWARRTDLEDEYLPRVYEHGATGDRIEISTDYTVEANLDGTVENISTGDSVEEAEIIANAYMRGYSEGMEAR